MKKFYPFLILILTAFLSFAASGCAGKNGGTSKPVKPSAFFNGAVVGGVLEMDYKNALAGILIYDANGAGYTPVTGDVSVSVDGKELRDGFSFIGGYVEFTEDYLKSLVLGKEYAVEITVNGGKVGFKLVLSDALEPAYVYFDEQIKDVYLLGETVKLPEAVKSELTIQDISLGYSLTDENGAAVEYTDGEITPEKEGRFTYKAAFYKNGELKISREKKFAVVTPAALDLGGEYAAACIGGEYDATENAVKVTGEQTLSFISIPEAYKYVRLEYKGAGSVNFDGKKTPLSCESYSVEYLEVADFNTLKLDGGDGFYVKSFTVSDVSCFGARDFESVNFAEERFLPLWGYNAAYGVPSYDKAAAAVSFAPTGNSWAYTLQKGILKSAFDSGYKFMAVTYSGGGTTRVFNGVTGEWNGFVKNLVTRDESTQISYSLAEASCSAALDETAGFSVITNAVALKIYELKFFRTGVDFNDANLADESNVAMWENDENLPPQYGGNQPVAYDNAEAAAVFRANGNGGTYDFKNGALAKAKAAGLNAIEVIGRGNGEVALFVGNHWDRKNPLKLKASYSAGYVYFGDLDIDEEWGITVTSSNAAGGEAVYIKEMRFVTADPQGETDYTSANLVSKELTDKWAAPSGIPSAVYDEAEGAVKFTKNGNTDVYNFTEGAVLKAQKVGKAGIKITSKGAARITIFLGGVNNPQWGTDVEYSANSGEYVTYCIWFGNLSFNDKTGIGILCNNEDIYIKEMVFVGAEVGDEAAAMVNANLAAKEYLSLWKQNGTDINVAYDDAKGALKLEYTKGKSAGNAELRFDFDGLLEAAMLLGKTKIVMEVSEATSANVRLRAYPSLANWNNKVTSGIMTVKVDAGVTAALLPEKCPFYPNMSGAVFSLDNSASTASCTIYVTSITFE